METSQSERKNQGCRLRRKMRGGEKVLENLCRLYPNADIYTHVYRKNKIYDLFINIKYNSNPTIKNKGSAIFLHLDSGKYKPTKGCIAITKKDFLKILPLINSKTKISIN